MQWLLVKLKSGGAAGSRALAHCGDMEGAWSRHVSDVVLQPSHRTYHGLQDTIVCDELALGTTADVLLRGPACDWNFCCRQRASRSLHQDCHWHTREDLRSSISTENHEADSWIRLSISYHPLLPDNIGSTYSACLLRETPFNVLYEMMPCQWPSSLAYGSN